MSKKRCAHDGSLLVRPSFVSNLANLATSPDLDLSSRQTGESTDLGTWGMTASGKAGKKCTGSGVGDRKKGDSSYAYIIKKLIAKFVLDPNAKQQLTENVSRTDITRPIPWHRWADEIPPLIHHHDLCNYVQHALRRNRKVACLAHDWVRAAPLSQASPQAGSERLENK